MKGIIQPTGVATWLYIFICLCLIGQTFAAVESLDKLREFHSDFTNHVQGPESLRGFETFLQNSLPSSPPFDERIVMNNSNPEQQVQNMCALNTNMHRDVVFDDAQSGDLSKNGFKNNLLNIKIDGRNRKKQVFSEDDSWSDDGLGARVDNVADGAMVSEQHGDPVNYQSRDGSSRDQRLGNYMNIDVSGINVQAINTVQGGSAVATSNIEIKPVQIINCPPEVEEKLK